MSVFDFIQPGINTDDIGLDRALLSAIYHPDEMTVEKRKAEMRLAIAWKNVDYARYEIFNIRNTDYTKVQQNKTNNQSSFQCQSIVNQYFLQSFNKLFLSYLTNQPHLANNYYQIANSRFDESCINSTLEDNPCVRSFLRRRCGVTLFTSAYSS